MKRFLLLLASVVIIGLGASANVASLNPFSKVVVNAQAKISVIESENYRVVVRSKYGFTKKLIKCDVKGNTLNIISTSDCWNENDSVEIRIYAPVEQEILPGREYDIMAVESKDNEEEV